MAYYDVSVPIRPHMPVYPGDPVPRLNRVKRLERGDVANLGLFAGSLHTGTHVDAPYHFIEDGATSETLSLETLIGPATVVTIDTHRHVTAKDLEAAVAGRWPQRLLLKTRNSGFWAEDAFRPDFVALTPEAAQWLVAHGTRLIGIDYLSVEPYPAQEFPVHLTLLRAGIIILEAVDLRDVPPGDYMLSCLPLRLVGGDAAPARVILTSNPGPDSS
jgi:arylformamidase